MFQEFNKIARLNRDCVISEKIDGTNAHVFIQKVGSPEQDTFDDLIPWLATAENLSATVVDGSVAPGATYRIAAGSRTRYITPQDDNFGFAKWVVEHAAALFTLGEGRHYGEWWGQGVQRGYGLREKKFSLFNSARWVANFDPSIALYDGQHWAPDCCDVVPVLYRGLFTTDAVKDALALLREQGSSASPGFMKPEGVVIFHTAANMMFKVTLEKDEQPKSRT